MAMVNPVAQRGEPAMMPSADLVKRLDVHLVMNTAGPHGIWRMIDAFQDLANIVWRLNSRLGQMYGIFLDS